MKEILDWLNTQIGLEGTIFFAFIVLVTSIIIIYIIKFFKEIFLKKDSWGKKAGELKDRVHAIEKEYHDFKNSLSWRKQKLEVNKRRLIALQDRLKFAKQKRKNHLNPKKNKKNKLVLPIVIFSLSIIIFFYIQNYN